MSVNPHQRGREYEEQQKSDYILEQGDDYVSTIPASNLNKQNLKTTQMQMSRALDQINNQKRLEDLVNENLEENILFKRYIARRDVGKSLYRVYKENESGFKEMGIENFTQFVDLLYGIHKGKVTDIEEFQYLQDLRAVLRGFIEEDHDFPKNEGSHLVYVYYTLWYLAEPDLQQLLENSRFIKKEDYEEKLEQFKKGFKWKKEMLGLTTEEMVFKALLYLYQQPNLEKYYETIKIVTIKKFGKSVYKQTYGRIFDEITNLFISICPPKLFPEKTQQTKSLDELVSNTPLENPQETNKTTDVSKLKDKTVEDIVYSQTDRDKLRTMMMDILRDMSGVGMIDIPRTRMIEALTKDKPKPDEDEVRAVMNILAQIEKIKEFKKLLDINIGYMEEQEKNGNNQTSPYISEGMKGALEILEEEYKQLEEIRAEEIKKIIDNI